jgi:hypothetical protein
MSKKVVSMKFKGDVPAGEAATELAAATMLKQAE